MGLALTVVIESKHAVKVTIGASVPLMMMSVEPAGLLVTQFRFEVITQRMLSPFAGL